MKSITNNHYAGPLSPIHTTDNGQWIGQLKLILVFMIKTGKHHTARLNNDANEDERSEENKLAMIMIR